VFRTTEWNDFISGRRRSLWIHGIPGAGKTILCSNIIQHLRPKQNRRTGWVYYYCYFGRNQNETEPLLRWIIVQLCQQSQYVPSNPSSAYRSGHELGINELLSILETVLEAFDTAFIAIDALDESIPYTSLLGFLTRIMTEA
jgi:Cdc6-like AAA superfamily ATPase